MGLHRNRLSIFLLVSALFGMAVVASAVAQAATITVVNLDGAGEGFNDPAPVAPVGGNPGITLGAQRLNAFQHAADIWGGLVSSPVQIRVGAKFDPQPCSLNGAVLGSAGPNTVSRDFAGALVASTWYAAALANALAGSDGDPGGNDISATFNSSLGTTCAFPKGWYYGLDASPGSDIDFVTVVVHELGHGLGFLTFVDLSSGAKFLGLNDTFMLNLERHSASPPDYPSMSNAQRVAASTNTGNLHWVGPSVRAASGVLTAGRVGDHVRMYAPNPQQPGSSVSHWDTALAPNQIMEPSYTGPLHDPVLELPLLEDIGWTLSAPPPPQPNITVAPASKDYGPRSIGTTSDQIFTVTNTGTVTLHVSATSITSLGAGTNPGEFSILGGVNAFDLAPAGTQMVTVRFAPAAPAGSKSATLRFASDDPDTPNKDVPLTGTAQLPAAHDMAVVKITVTTVVTVTPGVPVAKPVRVDIQNRSKHSEVLPNAGVLGDGKTSGLVRLSVAVVDNDSEGCQPATVALDSVRNGAIFRSGPKTIGSKAKLTVNYLVTYNCTNAQPRVAADATPGDYSYTATVHHEAIDGNADSHPADDTCSRPALGLDPNPDGNINDTGCAPVLTNVAK